MTPDEAAKLRQEIEALDERRKRAIASLGETLSLVDKERRTLESARVDKEDFIAKRVIEAERQAKTAHSAAQEATEQVVKMGETAVGIVEKAGEAVEKAIAWVSGLVQRAGQLSDSAQTTKDRLEAGIKKIEESYKKLEGMIVKNSDTEKALANREKEVEQRDKDATAKLQEAERLVYWHDNPSGALTHNKK